MKQLSFLFFLVISFSSFDTHAVSVEEAYASIPHKRTVFDGSASRLSKVQVDSLTRLFALTEQGIVLRVEGLHALRAGQPQSLCKTIDDYRALVSSLASLNVTSELSLCRSLLRRPSVSISNFLRTSCATA